MRRESCEEISAWLVDFADGELPEHERGRVETHVSHCAACRAELGRLRRSLELAQSVWQEAAAAVAAPCPPLAARDGSLMSLRRVATVAACAAAVLVVLGTWLLWRPRGGSEVASVRQSGPAGGVEKSNGGASLPGGEKGSNGEASPAVGKARPEDLDVEAIIAREGRAARLAAAIALLATEPSLKEYRERAERYLREAYPEAAAARPAGPAEKLPIEEPKS